ncbi:maleylpyruvate isomerase N-terminal domain-containing protein [Nonomuraea sp. NPDC049400]|uniref:maleylpyruvate isomerase N-terminal domain-containing protein n=1 Tax=Nonomuraea sp. NPDC049400 TaxID=3364352 RepID=UPI00378B29DD
MSRHDRSTRAAGPTDLSHRPVAGHDASLSDADITAPFLLPGWTRGHVLAHLAQNTSSLVTQAAALRPRLAAPCPWSRSHGAPLVTQAAALRPRLAVPCPWSRSHGAPLVTQAAALRPRLAAPCPW